MDRRTTLIDRFSLSVHAAAPEAANLAVFLDAEGRACAIDYLPRRLGLAPSQTC